MNLIDLLTPEQKKLVKTEHYHKDQLIFRENDVCNYISFVVSGVVNIISYTISGKEIIYNTIKEGGMFGNNLLFSSLPKYRGNIYCKTTCVISHISKDNMINILQNNKGFLTNFLLQESDIGKSLNLKLKILSFDSAIERLLFVLEVNNGKLKINSVSDLANQLFLSREATSRTVNKLLKEHQIKKINGFIELV